MDNPDCFCASCAARKALKAPRRDDLAQRILIARVTAWGDNAIEEDEPAGVARLAYSLADALIAEGAKPR